LNLDGSIQKSQRLLSASTDHSICIWSPELSSGIWIVETRLGDLSSSAQGFYGARWSPDAEQIVAHGYNGAFYRWRKSEKIHKRDSSVEVNSYDDSRTFWSPMSTITGHVAAVQDITWDLSGAYFISIRYFHFAGKYQVGFKICIFY
jgi:elongator complex protein 2